MIYQHYYKKKIKLEIKALKKRMIYLNIRIKKKIKIISIMTTMKVMKLVWKKFKINKLNKIKKINKQFD